jgi:hypothetical protein
LLGLDADSSKSPIAMSGVMINGFIGSGSASALTVETCLNGTARSGSLTGKVLGPIGGEVKRKPRKIE